MKLFILTLLAFGSLTATAESRFDWVAGQRKLVCSVYFPSGLGEVYIQSPEATVRREPGSRVTREPGSTVTVAYRKTSAETVYIGMTTVNDYTLRGPNDSWVVIIADAENTETEFLAELTTDGETWKMTCQRVPEGLAAPL